MIKVDDLIKIVKLVLLSGYIKKHKPLSLFVVGEAGIGKTEVTSNYSSNRVKFVSDLSKSGLITILKKTPSVTHLIIPDFIKITQKRRSTSDDLISLLNALTEEGLGSIDLHNFHEDFKGKQLGVITSTTRASFLQQKRNWTNIGFVSRMLFCSYSYSEETTDEVLTFIQKELYLTRKVKNKLRGVKSVEISSSQELNKQLEKISDRKFRRQKQMQTLAKCNALSRGDNKVKQEDIDEIIRLSKYLNMNFTKI